MSLRLNIDGFERMMAGRIIEARPLKSVDDLDRAKGIGAMMLAEFRPLVAADWTP
jgi:DNA uptake protein ComE-like DNA-binding protein